MNSDRFDGNAPAQALQAPEEHVERADLVGGAEEGQEEAQGPEAVGDLGVSRSKCRARVVDGVGGGRVSIFLQRRPGRDLGGSLVVRRRVSLASVLQAASHAFF